MAEYLRVKNWENFQHYKDRSPPWIKLHRELLRDYEFGCLQDASKLQLMLIWLLASQLDNRIPYDIPWLQKQLPITEPVDLKPLIDGGFLILEQNASRPLAGCKQSAMPETETEAETEADKEKALSDSDESNGEEGGDKKPTKAQIRLARFDEWWEAYGKKESKKTALSAWRNLKWAKHGIEPDDLIADTLNRKANDDKWIRGYQPLPATYLNGERWNDELPEPEITLPKDRNELWRIRNNLGLEYEYDDLQTCHDEIRQVLRAKPELSEVVGL